MEPNWQREPTGDERNMRNIRSYKVATAALLIAVVVLGVCLSQSGDQGGTSDTEDQQAPQVSEGAATETTSPSQASSSTTEAPTTPTAEPAPSTTATTTTAVPTTVPSCDPSWSPAADVTAGWPSAAFTAPGRALQEQVRIGTHPGYDRFVIEFEEDGRTPNGWSIGWISGTPLHDASGEPVDIAGSEFLEVRYLGSAGWVTYPEAWYQGPQEFFGASFGTANLVEAEMAGDYEGYVTWYVSANTAAPFNVFTLSGPPRLVVDICH